MFYEHFHLIQSFQAWEVQNSRKSHDYWLSNFHTTTYKLWDAVENILLR